MRLVLGVLVVGLWLAAPRGWAAEKLPEQTESPTSVAPPKKALTPLPTVSAADLELLKKILFTIEAEPDSGEAPLKVKFTLDLLDEELKKPRFHWDFGDGTTSKERHPTHVFKKPGEYKVSCRIDDVDDRWGRDELTIFVDPKE